MAISGKERKSVEKADRGAEADRDRQTQTVVDRQTGIDRDRQRDRQTQTPETLRTGEEHLDESIEETGPTGITLRGRPHRHAAPHHCKKTLRSPVSKCPGLENCWHRSPCKSEALPSRAAHTIKLANLAS